MYNTVPKPVIRILGLRIDTKLEWGSLNNFSHSQKYQHSPDQQISYLAHTFGDKKKYLISLTNKSTVRVISRAYGATRINVLEAETYIILMKLHLNQLQDMQSTSYNTNISILARRLD